MIILKYNLFTIKKNVGLEYSFVVEHLPGMRGFSSPLLQTTNKEISISQ